MSRTAAAIASLLVIAACDDGTGPEGVRLAPSGMDEFLVDYPWPDGGASLLREDGTPVRDFPDAPAFGTEGAWSPDGQSFVYDIGGGLARLPMDGAPAAVLLSGWHVIASVVVTGSATDGPVVFFGEDPDERRGFWRINLDGTGLAPVWLKGQPLSSGPASAVPVGISPDGKRGVWYGVDREEDEIQISSGNLDGSDMHDHTGSLVLGRIGPVRWSPDGTWFGFESTRVGELSRIYRVVGTRAAEPLVPISDGERLLAISPDGRRIAFNALLEGGLQVLLANADGTAIQPLLEGYGYAVEWSPDGEQIVAKLSTEGDTPNLVVVQTDGSGTLMAETSNRYPSAWRPRAP